MDIKKFYTPIYGDDLTVILEFLAKLQNLHPDDVVVHSPGEMINEVPHSSRLHGEYHRLVGDFLQALYDHGFVQDYDWSKFHRRALQLYKRPELLRRVTMRTCVKLLTFHARKDRFVDGHFAGMIQEGQLIAIIQRMEVTRQLQPMS